LGLLPINVLNVVRHPIGGIRNYLRYTYSQLDPSVYRATVLTVDRPEAKLLPAGMAPLPVELVTVPTDKAFYRLWSKARELRRTQEFHVVHSQGSTAGLVMALASRRAAPLHVLTLHETFRESQFEGAAGRAKQQIMAVLLGRVDTIVVVSQDALDNLKKFIPLSSAALDKVQLIRNGIAVETLVREAQASGNDPLLPGLPPGTPVLGYVGRFMPEKGFDVLIEAVRIIKSRNPEARPPFKVLAVNDGAFVEEYRRRIASLELADWFEFTGFRSSVAGVLTKLDAVVMPSLREAGPLVAMEAMVLGCVLIASDCVGLRELVAGTPALSSTAGDATSLADAIGRFLAARAGHRAEAQAYMPAARRAFDASVTARRLTEIFDRGLRGRSGLASRLV
jgi:glycosyltransferase involved in cell wall biosynthesis